MMENRPHASCRSNGPANLQTPGTRIPSASAAVMPRPPKKELMAKINQYSFAMNEANLFLDTHPYDTEALAYFQKYRDLRVDAVKEYAKYYAPLAIDYAVCDKTPWSWVNEPWPWEGVDC